MPGSGSAHRHAAEDDPVAVDVVAAADVLDRLEDIGLAGPAIAILHAPQRVQFKERLVRRRGTLAIAFIEAGDKLELAHPHRPRAAVWHDIQTPRPRSVV